MRTLLGFVGAVDWPHWQNSVPMTDDGIRVENKRYLASSNYHEFRKALITAIVGRFIALYEEWYVGLRIEELQ